MLIIEIALGIVLGLILLPIILALLERYIGTILDLFALIVVISIALLVLGFIVRNWNEFSAFAIGVSVLIGVIFGFAFLDLLIRPVFCKLWLIDIPRKIKFENIASAYKQNHRSAIKMTIESTLERGAIGMVLFFLFGVPTVIVGVITSSFTEENVILIGSIAVAWIFAIATRRFYVGRKTRIKHRT